MVCFADHAGWLWVQRPGGVILDDNDRPCFEV